MRFLRFLPRLTEQTPNDTNVLNDINLPLRFVDIYRILGRLMKRRQDEISADDNSYIGHGFLR